MAKELHFICDKCKDEISYGHTIILDVFEANKFGPNMQSVRKAVKTMDLCPMCFKEFIRTYNLSLEEIDKSYEDELTKSITPIRDYMVSPNLSDGDINITKA